MDARHRIRGRAALALLMAAMLAWLPSMVRAQNAACDSFATPVEAQRMAEAAAVHLERVGLERAFHDFMNTGSRFFDRDLYVFVLDLSGRLLANGRFPELIGSSALGSRDASGRSFVLDAIAVARGPGRGWIEYQWYNPCTGDYGYKSTYIIRVGNLMVGVGAYGSISA